MSVPKRVRWACPNGCPAVLASSRPRRDDVARYCLACSAKTGRLVLRVAPALETKRASKAATAKAKKAAAATRTAERETAHFTVHGVDLREELRKLWALPIARELRAKLHPQRRIPPPDLIVTNRPKGTNLYDVADWRKHTIRINRIPGHDMFTVRDTLAHELAHILAPQARHGTAWKTAYRLLCEQAYGVRPRVDDRFIHETHTKMRTAAGAAPHSTPPRPDHPDRHAHLPGCALDPDHNGACKMAPEPEGGVTFRDGNDDDVPAADDHTLQLDPNENPYTENGS